MGAVGPCRERPGRCLALRGPFRHQIRDCSLRTALFDDLSAVRRGRCAL